LSYRIHRSATPDAVVFAVSGDMDSDHASRLRELLMSEPGGRIVLDLQDISLVNHAGVLFLARVETEGIRIVNCPEYVRSWIAAERASRSADGPAEQSDEQ